MSIFILSMLYLVAVPGVRCGLLFAGLELTCEETKMRISAEPGFFGDGDSPFPGTRCFQLGDGDHQRPGAGQGPPCRAAGAPMVIHVGLQECGTQSTVEGDWLVYYNHLVLCAAVASTTGVVVQRPVPVIPVECHYKRKQRVSAQPLSPLWEPMMSTISSFGLLHFSLRTMTGDYSAARSSSAYRHGEMVFLEASVEASRHPPLRVYVDRCVASSTPDPLASPGYEFITNHGCLTESVVPGSFSAFLTRTRDDRLQFRIHAFPFYLQKSAVQMYIGCHLRVTLAEKPTDSRNKACFFHTPMLRWRTAEGEDSSDVCACCRANDCSAATPTTDPSGQLLTGGVATLGPLLTNVALSD